MPAQDVKLETKNHDPDKKLVKYMKEKSSLERKSSTRKARRKVDSKPKRRLRQITTKIRSLQNTKTEVLDEIVFPSMANLIFFFESISRYAELEENFQADITELFGIKRLCPRPGNYAYYFKL